MKPRAIVVVCDGLGVGALPDAERYGDEGTDTLGNVLREAGPSLPNLSRAGLLHALYERAPAGLPDPAAWFGRLATRSPGKDTTVGHWELMGLALEEPFPVYPEGFPDEVIAPFESAIGRRVLANRAASGLALLDELGGEHLKTGRPIVYTSEESVFQVAAHEEIVPLDVLYSWCETAREILDGPHRVGRVIARPFVGAGRGTFRRTPHRRDFATPPPGETLLDALSAAGRRVLSIGKVDQLFAGRGIAEAKATDSNAEGLERTLAAVRERDDDLVVSNLAEFDSRYGHRNDPLGFARALEELDGALPELTGALREGDLLVLTADHGADPTDISTDHTREYVPLLAFRPGARPGGDLGTRATLADVAATAAEHLGVPAPSGTSFLGALRRDG